jgi:hypothetical protein
MDDKTLLRCAVEFRVSAPDDRAESGQTILRVTRLSNHGTLGKGWVVCHVRGAMNPWYLNDDGSWRYKCGTAWETPQEAIAFFETRADPLHSWRDDGELRGAA